MTLTLANFNTSLPQTLLHKAAKCTVRECDESSKGFYEGYVDEGEESYDVSLCISSNKEITGHRCDCNSTEPFCRHKTALLLNLAGTVAMKAPAVKGKKIKQSKTDELLQAADAEEVKAWVKELLEKNKDLALSFAQRFGEKKKEYTRADAEALTTEAVKTVVKNRTRIEQSELKKIVELWSDVHKPIVDAYLGNVTNEEAFVAFHTVPDACFAFAEKVAATGTKINQYVESLLNQSVESIAHLYEEEAFETATAFYRKRILNGLHTVRLHYLQHLQNILSISAAERLRRGIDKLVEQYGASHTGQLVNGAAYTKTLFSFVESKGFLLTYLSAFKPIKWDNAFNELLIGKLIDAGALDLAKKYAQEQIAGNYREEYNLPYLEQLKRIYHLQSDEEGLAGVTSQLLPYTFDFDDYLFLYHRMPEGEEKKKWRTKLITKSKNASSYGRSGAKEFYFRLLNYEKGYKKMIDSINSYTPYKLILDYFEPMAQTDKAKLLKAIIDKADESFWGFGYEEHEKDKECFPQLLAAMENTYGKQALLAAVKQAETGRFYYRVSSFLSYLKNELGKG